MVANKDLVTETLNVPLFVTAHTFGAYGNGLGNSGFLTKLSTYRKAFHAVYDYPGKAVYS